MSGQHTPGRIDSTAFRRGVRAARTGASNPYNGSELRDEWDAGRIYAQARGASTVTARARAFVAIMQCPDCEPGATCPACFDAAIAKATGATP